MSDPFNKLVMDWEDCLAQKQAEIERLTKRVEELEKDKRWLDWLEDRLFKGVNWLVLSRDGIDAQMDRQ